MPEAVSDTGPILHLHEINRLYALSVFERLLIPALVAEELKSYGLEANFLVVSGSKVDVVPQCCSLPSERGKPTSRAG